MLSWLKTRLHSEPPEARAGAVVPGEIKPQATGKFRLEALEPRVLLSGDTPFAEVYRTLLSDEKDGSNADADTYIQQLDAETSAVIAAANGSDFDKSSSPSSVNVAWSEGWQVGVSTDTANTRDAPATDESDALASTAETENGTEIALLEQAVTPTVSPENSEADDDNLSLASSDQDVLLNDIPGAELPRGPPVNEQHSSVVIAAESIQINDLSLSYSSETDEGGAFDVQNLLLEEFDGGAQARAPPAETLTLDAAVPLLQEAIRTWEASGISAELVARLASIRLEIADLDGSKIGQASGFIITLDDTAAGRGWFVDTTPFEHSEYAPDASGGALLALAGGAASGRLDLLTVLLHEIGHVLGLDHDSATPVMAETLASGQRVQLQADDVAPSLAAAEPVTGALHDAFIDPVEIARQAFEEAQATLAGIAGLSVLTEDLPVFGLSLNDLLAQAGFGLFTEFAAAVAPTEAEVVAIVGTVAERLAGLEEMLEDVFGLVEDGADIDDAQIELAYVEIDHALELLFDFDLANVMAVAIPEFGLEFGLGLSFAITLDVMSFVAGESDPNLSLGIDAAVSLDSPTVELTGDGAVAIDFTPLFSNVLPDINLTGNATMDLGGYVLLAAGFGLHESTVSGALVDGDTLDLDVLRFDLTDGYLFVGVGAVLDQTIRTVEIDGATGFFVDDAFLSLAMASVTNAGVGDTRSWMGVAAGAASLLPVGLPDGYELRADNLLVLFNSASGTDGAGAATPLDWSLVYTDPADVLNNLSGATQLAVSGDLVLNLDGYVMVAGAFLVEQAIKTAEISDTETADLSVLRIDLIGVDLFVGVGGRFAADAYEVEVVDGETMGFLVQDANLSLAMARVQTPVAGDTRQWLGIAASASGLGPVGLPAEFEIRVDNLQLLFNSASGEISTGVPATDRLDWSALYDDVLDPLNALTSTTVFSLGGDVVLNLGGYVMVAGGLAISKSTPTGIDLGDNGIVDLDLLEFQLIGVDLFVGVGGTFDTEGDYGVVVSDEFGNDIATGLLVDNASLYLSIASVTDATPQDPATDTRSWLGLAASVDGLRAVGLPENFELRADNLLVFFNSASGDDGATPTPAVAQKIDWSALYGDMHPMNGLGADLVFAVSGDLTINLGGYVMLAGGFSIQKTTPDIVLPGDSEAVEVNLLRIDLTGVDLFVGEGGAFDTDTPGAYEVMTPTGAAGFFVDDAYLSIAMVSRAVPVSGDTRSWMGIAAGAAMLTPVGLPSEFVINVADLGVLFNQASGQDPDGNMATKLDWSTTFGDEEDALHALTGSTDFSVSGYLTLQIDSFVQISGGVAFTRSTNVEVTVTSNTGVSQQKTVNVLTLGFQDVNVFVGAGPYYQDSLSDGNLAIDADDPVNPDAVGLLLKDVDIAVALFKPTTVGTPDSYYAVYAFADDIELLGLDDLGSSDSFELSASGYRVELNGGSNGAINFAALDEGKLSVRTGPGDEDFVDFDYATPLQRVAIESARLIIGDYVHVSGGFALTRQTAMTVGLSGAGNATAVVDAFAFGASNVDLFVGDGPYFRADGTRDSGAMGLALENVDFGLLFMKSQATPANKYIALKATADRVGLVGLDSLKLSAAGVVVEYNGSNTTRVVDFSVKGAYKLDLGNGEIEFNFKDKLLLASVDDAVLQIESYVIIQGGLAFEKGADRDFYLTNESDVTTRMSAINVGAEDLSIFFGVDGPYVSDQLTPDAVGLAVTNANLALTLLKPATGGAVSYLGLHATADQVGFVGMDVFELEATMVAIDLNIAMGTGTNNLTPVVDFAGSFPGDELQALFNLLDQDGEDGISVAELDAALGIEHGAEASVATVEELIALLLMGGAPPPSDLSLEFVLGLLTAEFSDGYATELEALDLNGDGTLSPPGYKVLTGGGSLYLGMDQRLIHASADKVLVNIAEFVYVQGSIAFDLGSREIVTINTGVPPALADLASGAVDDINAALAGLAGQLTGLRASVLLAIDAAITTIETTLTNSIDELVTSIFDTIKKQLTDAIALVEGLAQDQLDAVLGAAEGSLGGQLANATKTLSADTLIDGLISPLVTSITDLVPDALKAVLGDLLNGMLSPIRELVSAAFDDLLSSALQTSMASMLGSVTEAVQSGLEQVTAQAEDAVTSALTNAEAKVRASIQSVLLPQIDRVKLQLERLVAQATAKLDPIFTQLMGLANIQIGEEGLSTLEDVEVEVTAIGVRDAKAFIGIPPPEVGFDLDQPFAGQVADALGLYLDGFDMALGIFTPLAGKQLPTFTAVKIHADAAGFSDGDPTGNALELTAVGVDVELNLGGPIVQGFGNAVIDFATSFPSVDSGPVGYAVQTGTMAESIYLDFEGRETILASIKHAEIQISEFVHITGSIAFSKGTVETVEVTGGLTGPLLDLALDGLGAVVEGLDAVLDDVPEELIPPWAGGDSAELSFLTLGAADVHAFVGFGGPYWSDIDQDGVVDEDTELSSSAQGLWIENFDFGMAMMMPTNPLDFVKYFALSASADLVSLVGIDGVEFNAENMLVEVNQSTPSLYGLPLFPVVDFATTYASERDALFNLLNGSDQSISVVELNTAFGDGFATAHDITEALTTVEQLMNLLDIGGAPPDGLGADGMLTVDEVADLIDDDDLKAAVLALDADGDAKYDPVGYEVNTGGTPVYLAMDSSLIRAQGFAELNLFDIVYITGSLAFELGPTQEVTLSDSTVADPSEKTVTTMTIGAANVTAFIGAKGPYWTDIDGNQEVSRDPAVGDDGNNRIDADESLELNDASVGFEITDLDVGIMVMASLDPFDLGVYIAAELNVNSFGMVGIEGLTATATGSFDVALNVGIGISASESIEPSLAVVDFVSSFSEVTALFDLLDADHDGTIEEAEQIAAFEQTVDATDAEGDTALAAAYIAGYTGIDFTAVSQLAAFLNAGDALPDDYLTMDEVRAKLKDDFENGANKAAIDALDADTNGRLNTGFEVNTGDSDAPVVLDFEEFQISIQLGGEIELKDVFRLYGVFIFEVDSTGLKAFVAAGLEIGPDVGSDSKIFNMSALGALVINGDGVAADLNVSVSIGGALSDLLQLNATARLVFNTTGENQSVTIPARYVDFLFGQDTIPASAAFDTALVSGLTLTTTAERSRLTVNSDGSATYTISGTAPGASSPGFYLLATFNADLTILRTFVIHADFRLLVTGERFDLGFNGTLALGGFGSFGVSGGAIIDSNGFAAFGSLSVNINLAGLVTVTGGADLKINTATSGPAAMVNGQSIDPNTYKVVVRATVGLFGVVSASGELEIGLENGVFEIAVNKLNIDLYILDVDVSGYIRSDGQFKLTGTLSLPSALSSGDWGVTGGISLSISNSGFSGYGSVGIKVFGKSFNIASATLSVGTDPYYIYIRAEGPLGVYIEITIDANGVHFDGGLGFLDDIIGAIGDVAVAVGQAIADAAVVVGAAFVDLGEAILDLGAAIGDALVGFVEDVGALIADIAGAIAEFFSSSRTIVNTFTPSPKYSYSWAQSAGTLTIDMKGGDLTGAESPLSLAVVNGQLIVDGPNQTANVKVAERQKQTRSWNWGKARWNSWQNSGSAYGAVYADIEYSNMKAFDGVTKIVIKGTEGNDTIVMDTASINIAADVYGYGGNDTILTGGGNDYVDGGAGNDVIFTYGGNDELHGGDGDDKLAGGTGNDKLYGGTGNDLLNESLDRGNNARIVLSETNLLNGGTGNDQILGSPGIDTIVGGDGADKLTGLNNDDIYEFSNNYGTDTFADYFGKAYLDFSAVTSNLAIAISDSGLTINAGGGHLFAVDKFISIQQFISDKGVAVYADFQIVQIKTGTGHDILTVTALPLYRMDIIDAGGRDVYDFDLDQADVAQTVARVNIVETDGTPDQIDLDVDSTGFDTYLHLQINVDPQAVLLNKLNLTFNSGIEILNLTDHAANTTITTSAASGPATLLIKTGVTIASATGGLIELIARDDFIMQVGAVIQAAGAVVIRGDDDDVDSTGATINLFGTINADTVTVYGNKDNDTVNITNVVSGAETTLDTGAGNDTINVGSLAPAEGGNLDRIGALLTVNGEGGSDTLNLDDTGDTNANTGALTTSTITGLGMVGGGITYADIATLNIGLGTAGDVFTIESTHSGETNLNANHGDDVVNVRAIAGITTISGGTGSEAFNVGSNALGAQGAAQTRGNNSGGTVDGIAALLTLSGNDPSSGSDVLTVDDTGDTNPNTGTLTATTITGLDMGGSISYGTIEHLTVSLGSGGNTFTISSTHGAATGGFQEDTIVNSGSSADTVHVNNAIDLLVVNSQAGDDTVNVNGTGAASEVTVNAGSGADTVNINNVTHLLTVNGQDNADTINVNTTGSASDVTVNAGAGTDTVNIYDGVSNLLTVNGDTGDDTIHVYGTGATSESTLNGDADNDTINVRAMGGTVNVNGGVGNDTVNVGSDTPTLPGVLTDQQGTIDAINGVLTVNGGGDSDTLNVDDSAPVVNNKSGELTAVALIGLDLEYNIAYSLMETLNIWLAEGDNSFTISSTHAGSTTLSTALGNDTVDVDGASGTLTINAEAGNDVINVRATGLGSQTFINGQGGDDVVNLSDNSPLLPVDTEGNIDAINGLISIDGGAEVDVINVDDSANSTNKTGTLSAISLRGLEMEAGVNYFNAEDFNLWLGTGTDGLYIDSTHAGTTDVFMGDGNATVNQRDDTVAIKSISGVTTVHGQGGNDFFYVNVQALSPANDANFFTYFKAAAVAAANESLFNALFTRTHANGLGALLNLHGDGDSDLYTLNLAGQGDALVNVRDNGAPNNGVDTLIINGADVVSGSGNQPDDTFLLRRDFVALLNDSDANGSLDKVERVNYDQNINARLIVNGLGGNDKFVTDDNSTVTTLDGGEGDDTFQIGQIFGTLRDAAASVAEADEFGTTPVIIGVISDPVTNGVIFDPTSFDPVTDKLSPETVTQINIAIAHQRTLGKALDGVAYVSQGVSHATTVFGGKGEDTFNVYHNKGTLRLEGEADNDTFTVRAFVTIDLSEQAQTEVNGGEGTDTINYAINAPVNIDGGAGFDRVVVLGTPFNDSFVVSSEGIFGAGLNVKFTNVEAAELDTLEGNDTIFILGTSEDIVTTVIGGLGDDTINVMGDVTKPVVSNDLLGRSGVITQGLSSTDADYKLVGVNGVAVNVLSAAGDSLIKITPSSEPLLVTEAGLLAQYQISLVNPGIFGTVPVYLTVSAGVVSSSDRNIGGAGVLVRVKGAGAFTNAVVLTFDGDTKSTEFELEVMAVNDSAAEGPRMALISHSINSANAEFDDLALIDIFVNVVDNDQPGLDIRHVSADGSDYGDNNTQVLENGFGDLYTVVLTAAPGAAETVTVTLLTDGQVTTNVTVLTFNAGNWFTPQQVTVTAVNDGLDGISISKITHGVTSTGGVVYASLPTTASSRLSVTVYDDDTPGAIVQQSDGSTIVVEGVAMDAYRVRLTQAPESAVTLTLRTDMQTLLSGAGLVPLNVTGTLGYFEYAYTFTTANWNSWANVTVSANLAFRGSGDNIKSFAPQDQNLDQIRGPIIIEGGVGAGVQRAFAAPVMLPGETNDVSDSLFGDPIGASSLESNDIDILKVFHTDNSDADTGRLFYRNVDVLNNPIANIGLALTGFEMGGDVLVEQGTSEVSNTVYYGGGITFNGFEIVEVLLGKGNETLTIDDTGDRDVKDVDVTPDHASITAIHGGGGDDTITINNRGQGPLVVYGDTSEDGVRYSNDQPAASIHGTIFTNPGNDTINASGMADQADAFVGVVIFGGAGNDKITGSQDADQLAGGTGNDTISGQGGNDHIYADASFNVDVMLFAQDQVTLFDASNAVELAKINAMFSVLVTAVAGGDTLYGDAGDDVIFGDHGIIDQVVGTRRIMTTGAVTRISTTEPPNGMVDTIFGGADNDVILGGNGGDTIDAGEGGNIVLGDLGYLDYVVLDQNPSDIDLITSTETTSLGGVDNITSGAGQDIIIGGRLGDTINAGDGDNLVIGDSGRIRAADSGAPQIVGLPITLGLIESTAFGDGGVDVIDTGKDNDIVLGGHDGDTLRVGEGNNIVLGDDGAISYTGLSFGGTSAGDDLVASDIDEVVSTSTTSAGGADNITSGAGQDIIIGGRLGDTINAGDGDNLVIGDSGHIRAADSGAPQIVGLPITLGLIESTAFGDGGVDVIDTGKDNDIVLGGHDGDTLRVGEGNNIVLGDDGKIAHALDADASNIDLIESTSTTSAGGTDTITSGAGQDIIIGGREGDTINAGDGDNLVIGDSGRIMAADSGVAQLSGLPITLGLVETIEYADGGADTITTGTGKDIILGGASGDDIRAGASNDIVHGDNASISYVADADSATLDRITTLANGVGGADTIRGEAGQDVLVGGAYGDRIDGGSESDLIFGDNVTLDRTKGDGTANARYRALTGAGGGQIYSTLSVTSGDALVSTVSQYIPNGAAVWEDFDIQILDHDVVTEAAAGSNFGNDYIAGGAGNDQIFGQLGNDTIQGDGSIDVEVSAQRQADGSLLVQPSVEAASDGDDYIEGNGGNDLLFGNLGQDDIIGGSSSLFSLTSPDRRTDATGVDMIFGGAGTEILRNEDGNPVDEGDLSHARDSDMILGDNGNIYRLVSIGSGGTTAYLQFGYDQTSGFEDRGTLRIVPRAAELLDYTPGGSDLNAVSAATDVGGADEIHGESGDDFIYGQKGNDVIFGEGQDDDIIGGYGNDWISGGTGQDGVLGDDGRIFTSRNGTADPLGGVLVATVQGSISTAGNVQQADLNVTGELKKSVDLTPFNVDPLGNPLFNPTYANDIIFGGLGGDFLHGGAGDDAISGAEALPGYYATPVNNGNVLGYSAVTGEFAAYNEYDPWHKVMVDSAGHFVTTGGVDFILNFLIEGPNPSLNGASDISVQSDGNDKIFGDLGNDWLVGGTGRDNLYGGWGDDLLNVDDDQDTGGGVNKTPDTNWSYEDRAFGGAGRDILIANTGGDRLIDWAGEFNSYVVPFAPFGSATVSRALQPQLAEFLYALSASDGADATRAADTRSAAARNGEPEGELGLVLQKDVAWQTQTGAPADPQPGNVGGSARDVLRAAAFTGVNTSNKLASDSASAQVQIDTLSVSAASLDGQGALLESTTTQSTQADPALLAPATGTTDPVVTELGGTHGESLTMFASPAKPSGITKSIFMKEARHAPVTPTIDFTDVRGIQGGLVASQQHKSGFALAVVLPRHGRPG